MDVKSSINGMAEAVTKCDRQLAVYTRVSERLEGFLRENQSPRVRQDSKRLKRTRDQSPAPEVVDLERESKAQTTTRQAPASMEQATPQNEGTHNATRQSLQDCPIQVRQAERKRKQKTHEKPRTGNEGTSPVCDPNQEQER